MENQSTNIIEANNLHFARGERVIFDGVDLSIPRGKIVAIMGPSGTGKTTLLNLIAAQLYPDQGTVVFNGTNIHELNTQHLMTLRRNIGMLFQSGGLFTNMTVFENVAFPLREHTDLPQDMLHDLVLLKLEAVGLRGAHKLMPSEISGGMARRVAMARALALDPSLMLYDEPFTGQDPITMGVLLTLIKNLNDALGLTSVIVSHDVHETTQIADYIYIIFGGKIIGQGTPDQLMNDDTPAIAQFLNGLPDGVVPYNYPAMDFQEELALC